MAPSQRERGSVLILMPVAVLVFIILGALAIDHTAAFMGERSLANASAAAANNAASALGRVTFYEGSLVALDPAAATAAAQATVERIRPSGVHDLSVETHVAGNEVTVTVTGLVDTIFSRAIPGGSQTFEVGATSRAMAETPIEAAPSKPPHRRPEAPADPTFGMLTCAHIRVFRPAVARQRPVITAAGSPYNQMYAASGLSVAPLARPGNRAMTQKAASRRRFLRWLAFIGVDTPRG